MANEPSACWLTPSGVGRADAERIQEAALAVSHSQSRTRTRTRTGGEGTERVSASARWSLWPLLRPKSDYLLSLCINSLAASRTVCMQKKPDLRVRLRALTVTALVWSTDLPLRTMLIGFISPMEVLSIERIYVHLYFRSWRVLYSNKTRARRRCQEPAASGDGGRRAADGGRLPRQGLGATATATYRFLHST